MYLPITTLQVGIFRSVISRLLLYYSDVNITDNHFSINLALTFEINQKFKNKDF